jgi:hypothetical protein
MRNFGPSVPPPMHDQQFSGPPYSGPPLPRSDDFMQGPSEPFNNFQQQSFGPSNSPPLFPQNDFQQHPFGPSNSPPLAQQNEFQQPFGPSNAPPLSSQNDFQQPFGPSNSPPLAQNDFNQQNIPGPSYPQQYGPSNDPAGFQQNPQPQQDFGSSVDPMGPPAPDQNQSPPQNIDAPDGSSGGFQQNQPQQRFGEPINPTGSNYQNYPNQPLFGSPNDPSGFQNNNQNNPNQPFGPPNDPSGFQNNNQNNPNQPFGTPNDHAGFQTNPNFQSPPYGPPQDQSQFNQNYPNNQLSGFQPDPSGAQPQFNGPPPQFNPQNPPPFQQNNIQFQANPQQENALDSTGAASSFQQQTFQNNQPQHFQGDPNQQYGSQPQAFPQPLMNHPPNPNPYPNKPNQPYPHPNLGSVNRMQPGDNPMAGSHAFPRPLIARPKTRMPHRRPPHSRLHPFHKNATSHSPRNNGDNNGQESKTNHNEETYDESETGLAHADPDEYSDRDFSFLQGNGWQPHHVHVPVKNHKAHLTEDQVVSLIVQVVWKVVSSYIFVFVANCIVSFLGKATGLSDSYLETHITLGNDGKHPFEHYGNKGYSSSYGSHGQGIGSYPAVYTGGSKKGTVKLGNALYHPASALYQQPTYQYSPGGKDYQLHGYDQHHAVKYAKKYSKKYAKKAGKYGLRPKPIGPYLPAYQYGLPPGPLALGWTAGSGGANGFYKRSGTVQNGTISTNNSTKGYSSGGGGGGNKFLKEDHSRRSGGDSVLSTLGVSDSSENSYGTSKSNNTKTITKKNKVSNRFTNGSNETDSSSGSGAVSDEDTESLSLEDDEDSSDALTTTLLPASEISDEEVAVATEISVSVTDFDTKNTTQSV